MMNGDMTTRDVDHSDAGRKWLRSIAAPYKLFWKHRRLLLDAVGQTLRGRYAGSMLGLAWLVVGPAILLGLYTLLYTVVFKVKPMNLSVKDYILYIFAGLVPFIAFGQALASGASSLATDRSLLLNRIFPAELIPAREVLAAGAFIAVSGGLLLLFKLLLGEAHLSWLLLPILVVLLGMATMGVVWAFAIANLVIKDVQQVIGYIVTILLIASPIAYTPDMVPSALRILLYANPFAYYVQSFQSVLVLGRMPEPVLFIGCMVFAFASFHGMYRAFGVGKRIIADHI
jgi:lipopolysaccharide transport system permease protein